MNRKVETALRSMTRPGDRVICAVSGGKDSMAMLHALWNLGPKLELIVSCAHLDHQLRGAESRRDAAFVADFCEKNGIPLTMETADVRAYATDHGIGIEEAARKVRYRFLLGLDPQAKIATAHTAGDNLETVLMHLLRGSSLHGLSGIPPVRDRIIRPLLTVSRAEITAYLEANNIPHVEDSTNGSDDCLRNRLRHHVLPQLEAENPNLPDTITRLTETLRREDAFLSSEAEQAFLICAAAEGLDLNPFRAQPEALRWRVMARFLEAVPELGQDHLTAALALCESHSPSARFSLPGGFELIRVYDTLRLLPPGQPKAAPEPVTIGPGQQVQFGPWQVTCRRGPAPNTLPPGTVALIPPELPLALRCRRPGDRIRLPGGSKKLSRFLIDQKIPALWRDTLPVAAQGDALLAVLPLRADHRFCPQPGQDCLLLTAIRMEDVK